MQYSKEKYMHLLLKGNPNQPLLRQPSDYDRFLTILATKRSQYRFRLIGYALFKDYIHVILEETTKGTLPAVVHGISLLYTKYYQNKYGIEGPVFSGSYRSDLIDSNKELICRLRYLHQKPKVIGLCTNLSYEYSSFIAYSKPKEPSMVDRSIIYRMFDKQDDIKASNLFRTIHHDDGYTTTFDVEDNLYEKVAVAKKILKEELTAYETDYMSIGKNTPFREHLIMKIFNESKLTQQEIADLLSISRHIVGRIIRMNRKT